MNISQSSLSIGEDPSVLLKYTSSTVWEEIERRTGRSSRSRPNLALLVGYCVREYSFNISCAWSCSDSTFPESRRPLISVNTYYTTFKCQYSIYNKVLPYRRSKSSSYQNEQDLYHHKTSKCSINSKGICFLSCERVNVVVAEWSKVLIPVPWPLMVWSITAQVRILGISCHLFIYTFHFIWHFGWPACL